jgi:repressor LexA
MKTIDKLSERQRNILTFMDRYVRTHGFPPTIREIGEATDINSTSVVNYNLNKLVRLGYLQRTATKSRGLRLVKSASGTPKDNGASTIRSTPALRVAYGGQIVAGAPVEIPSFQAADPEDFVEVVPSMLGGSDPNEVFALRVKGDSMIDAMIQDGDVVILRRAESARNGEMVAVWLDDRNETTLKYFYLENDGRVRLQPAHPTMEPIYVPAQHCHVQGRVLSVMRMLR